MIPFIRIATAEEVETIKDKADLTASTTVWSWPNDRGNPDLAVIRQCSELDPVFFSEISGNSRKSMLFWGICNMLKVSGLREVYFNIDADADEDYKNILLRLGAEPTTSKPQLRYKLVL